MASHSHWFRRRWKEPLLHPRGRTLAVAQDFLHAAEHNGCINDRYIQRTICRIRNACSLCQRQRPQFRSEEFTRFLKMNGVKHVRVAPYHAASNGLAERMVQLFKNHMNASKGSKLSIQRRIENFLLTYRSTKLLTTGRTLASLFLAREPRTSSECAKEGHGFPG